MECERCGCLYTNKKISKKRIDKNPKLYNKCKDCRKIKNCEFCNKEFKHYQNRTCSKLCANKLKEISYIKSCGKPHNFYKNSISRNNWENKLLEKEGIVNVFQRESVKEKSRKTLMEKYGVSHISKNEKIKAQKIQKIKKLKREHPNHFKEKWMEVHYKLVKERGYDPRLHVFGKASKQSLLVFEELIEWCLDNGISYDEIYLGIEGKNEYFLKDSDNNFYMYDFTIKNKKIIIEFHGVDFHAKEINEDWMHPFTKETSEQNILKRNIKNNLAKSKGFKLLEIWSDETPNNNLEKCKKFIKNTYENKINNKE